jgi:hypothetical protein
MWGLRRLATQSDATPTPSVDELAPLPEDIYADVDTQNLEIDKIMTRVVEQGPLVRDRVESLTGHRGRNHFSERAISSMRLIDHRSAS